MKNDEKKIKNYEENLQLYGFVKKTRKKLMNQIGNFKELKCEKSLNRNQ